MKKYLKALMGVVILPLLLVTYVADRVLLSVLVWMDSDRIDVWFNDSDLIFRSVVRLVASLVILGLIWLIRM